jgi:short-subunit dehydrogenase
MPQTPSALSPIPVAVIIGASSGIGEALATRLAREGHAVALVARRATALARICAALNAELGGERARAYTHDVRHYAEAPALLQQILAELGRLDVIVYNAGVQLAVDPSEFDFEKDRAMVEVNLLGALAWLNPAAEILERLGHGSLVGISSVAGDRGRAGAPAYNASKAGLTTFLEALRNRLSRHGVTVLTVKPGFVATDMLRHAPRRFWVISAEQAAADIWAAIRSRKQVVYVPARWRLVMLVIRTIPSFLFRRIRV